MDKSANLSQRLGVTPAKMWLIGALAVILVGLLYYQYSQYGGSGSGKTARAELASRPSPRATRRAAPATEKEAVKDRPEEALPAAPADSINQAMWQAPRLANVIEYDPFALPASFPQPALGSIGPDGAPNAGGETAAIDSQLASIVEELQTQLEELRQRGVTVIVKHRDKYVAMIGDRTVHVGDVINGFTIKSIEPGGVLVERKIEE